MRNKVYFIISIVLLLAAMVAIATGKTTAAYIAMGSVLVALILFYRAVALPLRTVRAGMDLLRSQDFASRLAHVGQKDADNMVDLYNSIITNLKTERLKGYEQNCFLSKLIEASPMGIAICDLDGNIETQNQSFKNFSSPQLLEALAGLPDEDSCTLRPGGMQVLRCSRHFFMDRGFRRPFFLVERLTDEIVRAETEMFHKIVRTMGHEVNNTLGGVISVLETLGTLHDNDPEVIEAVHSCSASCENLGNFVRSYSDIVKLPDAVLEFIDLNTFVNDSLPFLRKMCPHNIELKTELAAKPVPVRADAMLLQRVLVNAVKNAWESIGHADGSITIATAPGTLQIIDNGPGIAPEVADKIFSPFFSTKRADRGLGLMLIADILRKHHSLFSLATGDDKLTRLSITFR